MSGFFHMQPPDDASISDAPAADAVVAYQDSDYDDGSGCIVGIGMVSWGCLQTKEVMNSTYRFAERQAYK